MKTRLAVLLVVVVAMAFAPKASAQIFRLGPVIGGDSVRFRLRDPSAPVPTLRALSGKTGRLSGLVLTADGDSMHVSINAPIAKVVGIEIGHNTMGYSYRYGQLSQLDIYRGRSVHKPSGGRIAVSLLAGAAVVALLNQGGQCGDHPCTQSETRTYQVVAGIIIPAAIAFWPTSHWERAVLPQTP